MCAASEGSPKPTAQETLNALDGGGGTRRPDEARGPFCAELPRVHEELETRLEVHAAVADAPRKLDLS